MIDHADENDRVVRGQFMVEEDGDGNDLDLLDIDAAEDEEDEERRLVEAEEELIEVQEEDDDDDDDEEECDGGEPFGFSKISPNVSLIFQNNNLAQEKGLTFMDTVTGVRGGFRVVTKGEKSLLG